MKLVPTRYYFEDQVFKYETSQTSRGWSCIRVPIGKVKIPPYIQILTTDGWEPALSQKHLQDYFKIPQSIITYLQETTDENKQLCGMS